MNRKRLGWGVGTLVAIVLLAAVLTKGMGFTARGTPSSLESRVMLAARHWATPRAARDQVNPSPATAEAVRGAMAHWADHCATCHGNDGSGSTTIGRAVYPPAPDMRAARTQQLTDGELFYIIEHGVPFTAMPAWATGAEEGEAESWALVRFIRRLPQLTEAELTDMERLNPKSAGQADEDQRINDFLNGKSADVPTGKGGDAPHGGHVMKGRGGK
jgi:mono/diheme cytochrome c family protein